MDVMYVVSNREALAVLKPLLRASKRRGVSWGCFFTDSGVEVLDDSTVRELMSCATEAVACEFSWKRYREEVPCPIAMGSQTNHGIMVAEATHIVSL